MRDNKYMCEMVEKGPRYQRKVRDLTLNVGAVAANICSLQLRSVRGPTDIRGRGGGGGRRCTPK